MSVSGVNPSDPGNQALLTRGIDTAKYNAAQQNDTDKIAADTDNLAAATKSGDKGKIKDATKALKDDFKQAHKDGISKDDLKKLSLNSHEEVGNARIAKDLLSGKVKPDDMRVAASIHNEFVRYCKANGKDPKDKAAFQSFSADITKSLQQSGVPADQAQQAVDSAGKISSTKYVLPRSGRV